ELREHDRGFRREFERINAKEREMQDLGNELKVFHEQAKRRRHEISEMQRQLGELERQRPNPPDPDAGIRVQRELDEIYDREQEYNARIEEIQQERRRIHGEGRQLDNEIAEHSYRLQQLDDVKARKLRLLDVFHADTARAVRWLEGNRGKFTRHVFSPVCLQVNVKDPRYAPVIESLIRAATLKTFVCQCRDDYMTMTREVNDRLGLKINVVALPEAQQSLDKYHPPVDPRKLSAFGFEGYALDLVDAPAPVLAYLCSAEKLHAIPISLSEVDNEGIEASRQFSSYIAAGVHYTITKARYGNHNISVNSSR
ncbi:Structural maintenance of chromosomes protein 5, partial [Spiromyces aspiralis]